MNSRQLSGILLFSMLLLSIVNGLVGGGFGLLAGIAGWSAGILLFSSVSRLQFWQAIILLLVAISCLAWAYLDSDILMIEQALTNNQALLAMLASVSFLRLITLPRTEEGESLPTGKRALGSTLLGVHLFGAVINLSTVVIVGDRQSLNRPLSTLQAIVLSRGFSMAALWSPFFAAMGVALTNAPGAQITVIMLVGLPVAMLALSWSAWQLSRSDEAHHFRGYPVHYKDLWIPGLLAALVMLIHHFHPEIPVLTLISLLAVSLTIIVMLLRYRRDTGPQLGDFIMNGLPRMAGELVLFLAAGVLSAGISAILQATGYTPGLVDFGALEAGLFLILMVGLSVIGIHPVITIVSTSSMLLPLVSDPNLLAITFLMGWGAGVSISPLSGLNLALQGRYGIAAQQFIRHNSSFVLLLLAIGFCALLLYELVTTVS